MKDSSSLRRDDEYDDDTDQVEDEPMPLPSAPGSLHKFFVRTDSTLVLGKLFLVLCKSKCGLKSSLSTRKYRKRMKACHKA